MKFARGSSPTIVGSKSGSPIHDPASDHSLVISQLFKPAVVIDKVRIETAARVTAILSATAQVGETIANAFARKERELSTVFAALSPVEAHALHRKLASGETAEPMTAHFALLTVDRRLRLLAFLGDARRREAKRVAAR